MTKRNDDIEALFAVMDALADNAATASDREILDEAAAHGIDAKEEATRVRALMLSGVLRAKKQRLQDAVEAHDRAAAAIAARATRLPTTSEARRQLLERSVRRDPSKREVVVTLQNRDFESFSDSDIESALRQLDALGLLDDESSGDDE